MDFSPIVPLTGEAVFEALKVFGDVYHEMGVPPQNQFISLPWAFFPRAFVFLFGFPDHARRRIQQAQPRSLPRA